MLESRHDDEKIWRKNDNHFLTIHFYQDGDLMFFDFGPTSFPFVG